MKDLLNLLDLNKQEVRRIFSRAAFLKKAAARKKRGPRFPQTLKGKGLALIFEKASTRTKVSFEMAMSYLGGQTTYLESASSQLGRGETYADTGRVLSGYVDGIVIRTFGQQAVEELARGASVPVINGLSDLYHPCQILTDLFTIEESIGSLSKRKICYVGDGNNVANTWITASIILDLNLTVATPAGHEPAAAILKKIDIKGHGNILLTHDPVEAVREADVVNTDTWFSMGQKEEEGKRLGLCPFQVNRELLSHAAKEAIVLHCLPAHRGEEITSEVMDGPQSRIWDQAENRLYIQMAILEMFL